MSALIPKQVSHLPRLPRDFMERTAGMSAEERERERAKLLSAFNSARAQLRNWIQQDRSPLMYGSAKEVAYYLIECVNFETGLCFPSHETIADRLGIVERQVRRLMPRIAERGWIEIIRAARNKPTFYKLLAPERVVKDIEEGAHALKAVRDACREDRRYPHFLELEPSPEDVAALLNGPEMSAQPQSDRTFWGHSVRTSASGEHLKGTPPNDSLHEEGRPLRVSAEGNPYALMRDGEMDVPYTVPVDAADLEATLRAITSDLRNPPSGLMKFFRVKLMDGSLTPAMVEEYRRTAA